MKLYYSKGACSLAVRIVICELNILCTYESVNLKTKKTETDANFLEINAKGSVPALVLENHAVLTENVVIQQYLADTYEATELLPAKNDLKRYRVLEWLNFISTDLHKTCSPLFNPAIPEETKEVFFRTALKNKLSTVDLHLSKNEYLLDKQFTLADGYLFVILSWFPALKLELAGWQNLKRYYSLLQKRPSIQKALRDEN